MKYIKIFFLALFIPVSLIAILIGILSYSDLSLPLEGARKQFISKASELTGSVVRIDGEVRLAVSFFPTLVVNNLYIENKPGWSAENILSVGKTRVQLALMPLISGQLEFIEISASSIEINLEQASDGRQNWKTFIKADTPAEASEKSESKLTNIWVEEFRLADLNINFKDDILGREFTNQIDLLAINTHDKNHLTAKFQGTSKNIPYAFTAKSDLLRDLINNEPWQLDMQGHVADRPLNLSINIDHTVPALAGTVNVNAEEVYIGKTLSWLGLVDDLDIYSQSLTFNAKLAGENLKRILEQSTLTLQLNKGYWNLHDPADEDFKKVSFTATAINSEQKKPVILSFSGALDDEAIQMELSTNKLSDFFTELKTIHLDISTKVAQSSIVLKGDFDLPITRQTFIANIDIRGEKLDQWNGLLNSSIPPFGPYRIKGNVSADQKGFRINDARVNIGSSDLGGRIYILTSNKRTHWDLDLVSQTFQINDFTTGEYSLFPAKSEKSGVKKGESESSLTDLLDSKKRLRSSNAFPNTRATLTIEARQVLSGKDDLGHGKLQMELTDDSITINSFNLDIPGGAVEGKLSLARPGNEISGQLELNMDKLDYGVLYRHIEPESPFNGLISTRVNLKLAGDDLNTLMDRANGEIDFVVWPEDTSAGALNIWSVNLFLALLPDLREKESKFNCATVLLDVKDGQLSEELIFIDTTKIWMKGNIGINFPEETVSVTLFPTTKKARLFGLQVPIRLRGTFTDIGVTVRPFDIVKAYASFITSPLHAPFRRAFDKKAGDNLSELCGELLDRDFLKALLEEAEKKSPSLDEMYEYE